MGVICDTCSDANVVDLRKERIRQNNIPIREMKPPFGCLPNLHVTLVLLSYLGYEDEISELLHLLSKETMRYYNTEMLSLKQ